VINAKRAAYGIMAAAMGGGLVIPALSASAATQYRDTSVQAGPLTSHGITGTAGARDVGTKVKVSGLTGSGGLTALLTYAIRSGGLIDGVRLTASTDNPIGISGGNVTLTASGTPTRTSGTSEDGTVVLLATDPAGDVAVVSVPVVVGANSVQTNGNATTDEVALTGASDSNGSIVFTTSPAGGRVTESDLPRGLDTGNPLKPGDAAPGTYQGVKVKATDRAGAVATGSLSIMVNAQQGGTPPGQGQPGSPGHGQPTSPGHGRPTRPGHGQPTKPSGHGQPTPSSGHNSNHGYVVNPYSNKCLDATDTFGRARTTELQLWSCGAASGEDQIFTYTDHSLRYDARNGNNRYCVSEPDHGDRALLLAPCDNEATQYVTYDRGLYKYRDGRVLDDKSFGKSDSNPVLVFAFNGGANQRWTLPK
jgi:hypothetical protein